MQFLKHVQTDEEKQAILLTSFMFSEIKTHT